MRDPCIIAGPDGVFHLVWTISWNEKGIGYAHSKDLIHWTDISDQVSFPKGTRHGTVFKVKKSLLDKLLE